MNDTETLSSVLPSRIEEATRRLLVKACERELGQIRPEQYPSAAELRAEPVAEPRIRDVEPSVATLE